MASAVRTRTRMLDFRKLAAIDIVFLGYKLVLAEYVCGVALPVILGVLSLAKSQSILQSLVGVYLISLGINYTPMLIYTVSIGSRDKARAELSDELSQQREAMAKYRKLSILLLLPLFVPLSAWSKQNR